MIQIVTFAMIETHGIHGTGIFTYISSKIRHFPLLQCFGRTHPRYPSIPPVCLYDLRNKTYQENGPNIIKNIKMSRGKVGKNSFFDWKHVFCCCFFGC